MLQLNPGLTCPVSPPSEIILVRLLEGVDVCVIAGVLQQRPPHQRNSNAHGIIELVLHGPQAWQNLGPNPRCQPVENVLNNLMRVKAARGQAPPGNKLCVKPLNPDGHALSCWNMSAAKVSTSALLNARWRPSSSPSAFANARRAASLS